MNNPASFLLLLFLIVTFLQSGYDKLFYWKDNLNWLKQHFSKTIIKNNVPIALGLILVLELITSILGIVGAIELLVGSTTKYGYYAGVLGSITLLCLLFGQRLAKDYDGARTIVIYLVPTVLLVYWLN